VNRAVAAFLRAVALHHRRVAAALACVSVASVAVVLTRSVPIGWDESVYIGIAKYLYSGGNQGLFEGIRPPVLPLLIGAAWRLGVDPIWAGRAIAVMATTGAVIATLRVARLAELSELATAFLAIALATPFVEAWSAGILTHPLAVLLAMLAVHDCMTAKPFRAGVFVGLAFATRFSFGLVVAVVFVSLLVHGERRARNVVRAAAGALLPAAGLCAYNLLTGTAQGAHGGLLSRAIDPMIEAIAHQSDVQETPLGAGGDLLFYTKVLFACGGAPALAIFAPLPRVMSRAKPAARVVAGAGAALFAYYSLIPNKQDRYALDFLFFAVVTAAAVASASGEFARRWASRAALAGLACLALETVAATGVLAFSGRSAVRERVARELNVVPPVEGYARYFAGHEHAKVLTSYPGFALYSRSLFIAIYGPERRPLAILEANPEADYVVYDPAEHLCIEAECKEDLARFEARLRDYPVERAFVLEGRTVRIYRLR
jgi:hypothetical protein